MKKFEYKRALIPYDYNVDEQLKTLGEQGWELVAINFVPIVKSHVSGTWYHAYFKREIT